MEWLCMFGMRTWTLPLGTSMPQVLIFKSNILMCMTSPFGWACGKAWSLMARTTTMFMHWSLTRGKNSSMSRSTQHLRPLSEPSELTRKTMRSGSKPFGLARKHRFGVPLIIKSINMKHTLSAIMKNTIPTKLVLKLMLISPMQSLPSFKMTILVYGLMKMSLNRGHYLIHPERLAKCT